MVDYPPRSPRHSSSGAVVQVRRAPGGPSDATDAQLVNMSREGFQLRSSAKLDEGELLVMSLSDQERELDIMFPAEVRWQSEEPGGQWLAGCQSSWTLDLETLGELFLTDVLVAD